jgi:pyruvate kinase
MQRFTKIVATLGPASSDEAVLRELISAGLDVARLNFSHGSHESHGEMIDLLRRLSDEMDKPITILQDLQGPKLRVGILPKEGLELVAGQRLHLVQMSEERELTETAKGILTIPLDVPDLAGAVSKGKTILMDDGNLELLVTGIHGETVEVEVVLGGHLTSNKGVNLPGAQLNIPSFTQKDQEDLEFGLQRGIDAVVLSFVRRASDIQMVRRTIQDIAPDQTDTFLIAKIELPKAIQNLEEILREVDGVMVARGDLAVETSPGEVPILQKRIIQAANRMGKVVITATQMLESMIENPRPTRAEASDVANAVFDGTDAVMLSAETAIGHYPVQSLTMMDSITRKAERHLEEWKLPILTLEDITDDDAISVTRAGCELAHARRVSNIAVFTNTGRTAVLMSKARPCVSILAFTPQQRTYQRLGLLRGVKPHLVPFANSVESMLELVEGAIVGTDTHSPGQKLVVISGFPVGEIRLPNFALLHEIQG